jgi:sigma-B regulation protein RsbU (phosphoserine phosphatase)
MRYRWKLLILLLLISLIPMLIMRTIGIRAAGQMREVIITETRNNLISETENRFQLIAGSYSLVMWKTREMIEAVLVAQATQVERVLTEDSPFPAKVYFPEDFRSDQTRPEDSFTSPFHYRSHKDGSIRSIDVSYENQVFKFAPGIDENNAFVDIARLSTLNLYLKQLSKRLEAVAYWQTVTLSNGLYSSFPGHGAIPKRFDPRQQAWFDEALNHTEPRWSLPFVDPVTRQVVLAASISVKRYGGDIAGVTSIIVPISSVLEHPLLAKNIPPSSQLFMSYLTERQDTGQIGARIYARDEQADVKYRHWRAQIEPEWLTSEDQQEFAAMLKDIQTGNNNIRRMKHDNQDSVWVYSQASDRAFFVLITPYQDVISPIKRAGSLIQEQLDAMMQITRFGLAAVVFAVIGLALIFSRTVTKPLWALVQSAKQLAGGDLDARVDIRSRDEFGTMGDVFNRMGPELKQNRLMRQSLEVAMEVQRSLLPKHSPAIPGLDIAGVSIYCDETGGDYYDFLETADGRDDRLSVVVGDVSGHGIPAALLMTTVRAFLRQRVAMPGEIDQIIFDTNKQLVRDVEDSGSFVTLFYSMIDIERKSVSWVRAGHDPAIVYDRETDTFGELGGKGLALGVTNEAVFERQMRDITPGQILVIGTDGIWEEMNENGEMFGRDRLRQIVRERADQPSGDIVQAVVDAVSEFRQPLKQADDITLVIVKLVGQEIV